MLIQRLLRKQDRLTRSRITDLYSGILRYNRQSHHLSFPVAPCCPPGRGCYAQTPSDIGIDTKKPLSGTVPPYTQHVVISTGRDDWASRIESEQGSNLARDLKELLGPKGEFHNVGPLTYLRDFWIAMTDESVLHLAGQKCSCY